MMLRPVRFAFCDWVSAICRLEASILEVKIFLLFVADALSDSASLLASFI